MPRCLLGTQAANTEDIRSAVDANQAVRLMLEEITRLQRDEVTAEELLGTTQHFLTRYYLGQETNGAQAGELAQAELIGGGWRNSAQFIERLRAVTAADVKRVSQLYMRNLRFVVIGNPKSIDPNVFTGRAEVSSGRMSGTGDRVSETTCQLSDVWGPKLTRFLDGVGTRYLDTICDPRHLRYRHPSSLPFAHQSGKQSLIQLLERPCRG